MTAILDIDTSEQGLVHGICELPDGTQHLSEAPTLRELKQKMKTWAFTEHKAVITRFKVTDVTYGV
jgi:putative hemolysin